MNYLGLFLAFVAPACSIYAHIAGTYDVHGHNPDGSSYAGTLVIEKPGDYYTATWALNDGSSTGSGVRKDDFLSFNFVGVNATDSPIVGVQLYEIHHDALNGPWVINGETSPGAEFAHKRSCE